MIQRLLQKAISDLETNYVGRRGCRLVVHRKYYIDPSDKWYSIYVTGYVSVLGIRYTEIAYYNSLAFLYHYYFTLYQHIFLKSEHPELLI